MSPPLLYASDMDISQQVSQGQTGKIPPIIQLNTIIALQCLLPSQHHQQRGANDIQLAALGSPQFACSKAGSQNGHTHLSSVTRRDCKVIKGKDSRMCSKSLEIET